jgi:hypothetical protein
MSSHDKAGILAEILENEVQATIANIAAIGKPLGRLGQVVLVLDPAFEPCRCCLAVMGLRLAESATTLNSTRYYKI